MITYKNFNVQIQFIENTVVVSLHGGKVTPGGDVCPMGMQSIDWSVAPVSTNNLTNKPTRNIPNMMINVINLLQMTVPRGRGGSDGMGSEG